jgi:hypothetical protein
VTNSPKVSCKNRLSVIVRRLWAGELSYSFIPYFFHFYFLCISSVERERETTLVLFTLLWLVDLYIIHIFQCCAGSSYTSTHSSQHWHLREFSNTVMLPYLSPLHRKLMHFHAFISALAFERVLKCSHARSL